MEKVNSKEEIIASTMQEALGGNQLMASSKQFQHFIVILIITILICLYYETRLHTFKLDRGPPVPIYVPQKTISINFWARLGNQMFQFASLLGIAARNNLTAVIPYNPEMERIFKISTPNTKNLQNTLGMYLTVTQFYGRCCYYDILTETLDPRHNYLLYGYFQSWKYFKNVNEIVRQEFQFREEILNEAKKFHRDVSNKFHCQENNSCTFVGIHIRRGDISDYDVYKKAGYTTPSEQYFKTAMNFFKRKHKNKVVFIVCSDSSKGWQKKLASSDVVFSHAKDQGVDLAILSLCQHMIISTGTYGWWAAFLTGGTTIYYRDWPKAGSWLYDQVFKEDYFVRGWIPMK